MATVVTHEDVIPPIIPNTVMQKKYLNGVFTVYTIAPAGSYVLHDKTYDSYDFDGNFLLGYRTTTGTCAPNYDFLANPREFYAVLESEVPPEQILDVTTPLKS